jgi:RNA polymerase sigma factor (sigma-70 family)
MTADASPPQTKKWSLTQRAFENMLARLDSDRERAGEKYELIRQKLITFFEHRACKFPDDYADETINRVARRLDEGKEIHTSDPASYFFGVARNVVKESWIEGRQTVSLAPDESLLLGASSQNPDKAREFEAERNEDEQQLECLERCLEELPKESRELITRYYDGEQGIKIRKRKQLAKGLGISLKALGLRALRIREKLEDCVQDCYMSLSGR